MYFKYISCYGIQNVTKESSKLILTNLHGFMYLNTGTFIIIAVASPNLG